MNIRIAWVRPKKQSDAMPALRKCTHFIPLFSSFGCVTFALCFVMAALSEAVWADEETCACTPQSCLQFNGAIEINGTLSSRRLRYTDDDGYTYRSYFLTFDAPRCIALKGSDHGFVAQKIQILPNAAHFAKDDFRAFEGSTTRLTGGLISAYREDHRTPTLLIADQIK